MQAVLIHETGRPDVLRYEDADRPEPDDGQVLIRVHAAACSWLRPAGFFAIVSVEASANSAYPPPATYPNTSSPSAMSSARESSTVPETSLPSTAGSRVSDNPRRAFQSVGLTDAAFTPINTWPSPGSGRSASS